ncbi:MAG TPA: hypothetical protein VFM14_11635 [Gemmatimonadales bacterium]|nr:hypothetical protein [Gemmatimonadales bacterium]
MSARRFFSSVFVMFSLATTACGGGSDATGPSGPSGPSDPSGPSGPSDPSGPSNPAPSPSVGTLEVSNPTSVTVYYIKVRACGTTDFGSDLLLDINDGVGGLLQTGETGHWSLGPGCYDVRLSPSNANLYVFAKQIHSNVQITAGQTTAIATGDWQPYVPGS